MSQSISTRRGSNRDKTAENNGDNEQLITMSTLDTCLEKLRIDIKTDTSQLLDEMRNTILQQATELSKMKEIVEEQVSSQLALLQETIIKQQDTIITLQNTVSSQDLKIEQLVSEICQLRLSTTADIGIPDNEGTKNSCAPAWNTPKNSLQSSLREIIKEEKEKDTKQLNLIIFNAKESSNSAKDEQKKHEDEFMKELTTNMEVHDIQSFTHRRLGKYSERAEKSRPILLTFNNTTKRNEFLNKAKNLARLPHDSPQKKISIRPDLTKQELEKEKKLVQELRQRRGQGERLFIRNGQILEKRDK